MLFGGTGMYDAAVITAIYDGYDTLKPVLSQAGLNVDWVLVTDDPYMVDVGESLGWRVALKPRPGVHPNRAAKRPKFLPWEYTDAHESVWVDGSFRVLSADFVREALRHADPIAQFRHPWRDCLYAEARTVSAIRKYESQIGIAEKQSAAYADAQHPEHWGLWATGVIARRHVPGVVRLGERWLEEVERWTFQDQISQPFVLREMGLRPAEFPGSHLANGWMQYEGSGRH